MHFSHTSLPTPTVNPFPQGGGKLLLNFTGQRCAFVEMTNKSRRQQYILLRRMILHPVKYNVRLANNSLTSVSLPAHVDQDLSYLRKMSADGSDSGSRL